MVLVRETENEIDRQLRYFLEEKLEGILDEARKVKKRRQEVLHGKKAGKEGGELPQEGDFGTDAPDDQLTLWNDPI
ncbi:hypothetical protein CH370_00970 [Leptospira kmetyi]|uniref:Uncharacterized protein n=1 Tax=Leptospira kmetyi TaxID=408139 RepID=A0A2M9XW94_9LEPT|nr:hypothetical protein [Leptospira kmetyi]AYV57641.1 hypothetical protein EFP84_18405 [Leptospira kmetyi]PJZ43574.1 hypothetical protein CH370_00970 [Leptospira kmetyi]TGK21350.1 hypothetical protein EHO62_02740 [Leptospira kmetyi]TGK28277.1 hypothetical protein EHO66_12220 [Leptospira kmetyi]TGL68357.1 hypothetical protein EHQ67_14350 [Leptospira kmetyi]